MGQYVLTVRTSNAHQHSRCKRLRTQHIRTRKQSQNWQSIGEHQWRLQCLHTTCGVPRTCLTIPKTENTMPLEPFPIATPAGFPTVLHGLLSRPGWRVPHALIGPTVVHACAPTSACSPTALTSHGHGGTVRAQLPLSLLTAQNMVVLYNEKQRNERQQ